LAEVLILASPVWVPRSFIDIPAFSVLGGLDLLGALEGRGHAARLLDALLLHPVLAREDGWVRVGAPVEALLEQAQADPAGLVVVLRGPYLRLERNLALVLDPLVAGLARAGRRVILADGHLGDTHYLEDHPRRLLVRWPEVEAVITRESSLPLLEYLEGRASPGLHLRPDAPVAPLDAPPRRGPGSPPGRLPLERVDVAAYVERFRTLVAEDLILEHHGQEALFPLSTSRGCPFACSFCTREEGRSWEGRPLDQVEREAAWLKARGVERLLVVDPVANLDEERFADLLERLARLGLRASFVNGLRVDRLSARAIGLMPAVAAEVTVSIESADPQVLHGAIGKRLDLDRVEATFAALHSAGVRVSAHFLIGAPGETPEQANRTLVAAADWQDRFGVRPLAQFYVPRERFRLPPGRDAFPDDFYDAFSQPSTVCAIPAAHQRLLKDNLDRKREEPGEAKLIVNLSYRCNNNCTFCSVGDRPRVDGDLALQLAHLRRARERGVRLLDLDGGEPTLHPRLFEILDEARALGYERVTVTSNGRRLAYPEFARRLASHGVQLLISLHGSNAPVHEALTRSPGSFGQTARGVAVAARAFREFGVNTTVVQGNLEDLPSLGTLLEKLGARRWTLQYLTPFGNAQADQVVDPGRAREVFAALIERFRTSLHVSVIGMPYCYLPGLESHVLEDHFKMAREMLFVDGTLVNLGAYLRERRYFRADSCDACPFRLLCGGFWRFDESIRAEAKSP
jgi:MoaA/NifB/PqqE/SkfB family radical SAM enzyme